MDLAALLMSDPKIILLDEPAGGVNPTLLEEIIGHIRKLNAQGLTVLIVEHNMELIMRLSHRVVVMAQGRVIADGHARRGPRGPGRPRRLSRRRARGRRMTVLLEVKDVVAGYGDGPAILNGASLEVQPGKVHCIIGPNGAGKSTLLKAICGMLKVTSGAIRLKGQSLAGLRPDQVLRRGICFVPQERALFPKMTVRENLRMGGYSLADKTGLERRIDEIEERFPILRERRDQHAGTMSGGQQQTLAMARTMIIRPEIVMLDEPSLGLAPKIVQEVFGIMRVMAEEGITILIVEQNALVGLRHADWGVVLDLGRTLFQGPAEEVLADPRIQELYLGGKRAA